MLNWMAVLFASFTLILPMLILAYYYFRLGRRLDVLISEISELHLESEYLRLFRTAERQEPSRMRPDETRKLFKQELEERFYSDNRLRNYVLPFVFTAIAASMASLYIYNSVYTDFNSILTGTNFVFYAIMGALLYIYPLYISRYSSLSLSPEILFELLGSFMLSILTGLLAASIFSDSLQSVAAFMGGWLPFPAIEFMKKKSGLTDLVDEDKSRLSPLMEIAHDDRHILAQFEYAGIHSVLELAHEQPLRLFLKTDLNLVVCIDVVDQAKLHLFVPDSAIRKDVWKYGIRGAIDLMTLFYEDFPEENASPTTENKCTHRFLQPEEPLPTHLKTPAMKIAKSLGLNDVESLRNLVLMMGEDPQLLYILRLWEMIDEGAGLSTTSS